MRCKIIPLILMFVMSAYAVAEAPVARLAAYEYPPLYHTSLEGHFSGTLGETIKQICLKGELNCQTGMWPIARAYEQVISSKSDITISAIHPRFNACCEPSDWRYPWSAGFFTSLPAEQIPKSEAEMEGRSMIMVRGWRSHYRFMPGFDQLLADKKITVQYANSNYSAIQMLKNGRAELLWGSVDFLWYLDKLNLSDRFEYAEKLQIPIVLWVSKQKPEISKRLNAGFAQLLSSGQLDKDNLLVPEILYKYYEEAPMKKTQ